MKNANSLNVLANPEIQLHTDRILALQKDEQQGREALGRITAAIGAELIAVKEALDKTQNKTAWLRWLKNHVHYSSVTAWRYMEVARFIKKSFNGERFFDLDLAVLYRLAALPEKIVATLTPETLLTDPRTGKQIPLKEMSFRELDRALDALEGKTPAPGKPSPKPIPKPEASGVALKGETREEYATDTLRLIGELAAQIPAIKGRKGSLTGASKQRVLTAIEQLRGIVLKWPAWATPGKKGK